MTSHSLCTPLWVYGLFFIESTPSPLVNTSKKRFTHKRFILSYTEHPAKKAS